MRVALYLLAALAAIIGHPAQAADLFAPVAGDLSVKDLLQPVFGELFGGSGGGQVGAAIEIFNGGALLLGGCLAAYTLTAGTMQTAHDGEMMGKKWSSMWLPIRTVIGTSLVVPINSYNGAQLLLGWFCLQGIGMADAVWSTFVSSALTGESTLTQPLTSQNVSKLAFGMLRSQVCMQGYNWTATHDAEAIMPAGTSTSGDFTKKRSYGVNGFAADQCGGVSASYGGGGMIATGLSFFGINTGAEDKAKAVRQAHQQAAATLENSMATIAGNIVNSSGGTQQAAYSAAINAYEKTVADVAKAQLGNAEYFKQMAENASKDGWILAGSWFMRFVSIQDSIMKALGNAPSPIPPAKAPEVVQSSLDRFYEAMNGSIGSSDKTGLDNQLVSDKSRDDSESGILAAALDKICNAAMDVALGAANWATEADTGRHPVMVAASSGATMINAALALLVAAAVVGKLSVVIGMAAVGLATAILGAGVTLAYALPLMPFLVWIGAVAGWLLLVAEGILGASLWSVAHLNPRGDELTGSASAGYMLIIDLTLRPVLMVLGFICALSLSYPLGQFTNKIFFSTFQMSQDGGFIGLIGWIAACGLYAALMIAQQKYCFAMIHKIPDEIMKWFGGGRGSGLADAAGSTMQAGEKGTAAAAALGGAAGSMMTQKLRNENNENQRKKAGEDKTPADAAKGNDPKGGAASSAPMQEKGGQQPNLMAVFIQKEAKTADVEADQEQHQAHDEDHDKLAAAHELGQKIGEVFDDTKEADKLEEETGPKKPEGGEKAE